MKKKLLMGFIIAFVVIMFFGLQHHHQRNQPIACTMDAKQCPDGSWVGRIPPDCEFAPCPDAANTTGSSQTTATLLSPAELTTTYITAQERPPGVLQTSGKSPCTGEMRTISTTSYCTNTASQGAAGSIYTTYTYSRYFSHQDVTVTMTFILRAVQCANYDDPEKTACEKERSTFSTDALAHQLFETLTFAP